MELELTQEMVRAIDRCSVATLIELRRRYPVEGDWLYTTMIARGFIDMLKENRDKLDVLIEMFNSAVDAPVQLVRKVQ